MTTSRTTPRPKRQKQSNQSEPCAELVTERKPSNEKSRKEILAAEEAEDLSELQHIAACAKVVEFDRRGRVARNTTFLPTNVFDAIEGLVKITLPPSVLGSLTKVHEHVKIKVGLDKMVPWAGVGQETTRLRGFGFLGEERLERLDATGIRLYAVEKTDEAEIKKDELANRRACTVVVDEWKDKAESAAKNLMDLLEPAGVIPALKIKDLIALQPNLHNGAAHLAAHLDFPRHEGFGKVICTVAVRGAATILLIGADCNDENGEQPAWRFRLSEGDCYVLSGRARNRCLHAVLADDENGASEKGKRESLNLRFGLHTAKEAEVEVTQWWPDAL